MSTEKYAEFISEQLKHNSFRSVEVITENKNTFNNLPNKVSDNLRHDADRSGHIYAGKHGNKYSDTLINHDHVGNANAIHNAVKKQNPHLSADEHKSLANAIHKDLKANS